MAMQSDQRSRNNRYLRSVDKSWDGSSPAPSDNEDDEDQAQDLSRFETHGPGLESCAQLDKQGRISVMFNLKQRCTELLPDYAQGVYESAVDSSWPLRVPRLNIVIFIVGSRGDVQPYIAAALRLVLDHGHRVRIATHDVFESFVLEQARAGLQGRRSPAGEAVEGKLEFFPIGGDPKALMAYMVKNPGLLPGFESLTNGDISAKQYMIKQMLKGFYKSTFLPCPQTGEPFAADAIISNPPAFAHVHVAQALGIPLTMSFTMPWSGTTAFSHPLVQVKQSNAGSGLTNYLSFAMAEVLTWQGLGAQINRFRRKMCLDRLSLASGASVLDRLKVPYIYCWSSTLIPKPNDWKQHIDLTGFLFLETLAYEPAADLATFLASGPPPIYIGFGSIVVDDPGRLTSILLDAVAKTGARAFLSAGWSDMGANDMPDNVFLLGDCPHDWLFAQGRVSAICIHGGAGTTAIGLKNGLPVIVVPFFGDQEFWGKMVAARGAGPDPIPYAKLTSDALAEAITIALSPNTVAKAKEMGQQIRSEDGSAAFADAFHRHLPLLNMRCQIETSRVAYWWHDKLALRFSGAVAEVLLDAGVIRMKHLELHKLSIYDTRRPTVDPVTGGTSAILKVVTDFADSLALLPTKPAHGLAKMTYAMPKGIYNMLTGVTEGFEQMPTLWGTPTHTTGRVTGFGSGLAEGGRSAFYGIGGGLSSIVMDPYKGAKAEGMSGFGKGLARGTANLAVQPIGGLMGFAAWPIRGAVKSIERSLHPELAESVLSSGRIELGKREAALLTRDERNRILVEFEKLTSNEMVKSRKQELKAMAEEMAKAARAEAQLTRADFELPGVSKAGS